MPLFIMTSFPKYIFLHCQHFGLISVLIINWMVCSIYQSSHFPLTIFFFYRRIPTSGMFAIRSFNLLCRRSAVSTWRNKSQSAGKRLDISGIYPPIATPFTRSEDVDYQRLDDNLKKYGSLPFRGELTMFALCSHCLTQLNQT